jgi:hypothetical protein
LGDQQVIGNKTMPERLLENIENRNTFFGEKRSSLNTIKLLWLFSI